MKIAGVVCTPRVGGNSEVLVMQALAGAAEAGAEGDIILVPLPKVFMKNRVMVKANRHNNDRWPR